MKRIKIIVCGFPGIGKSTLCEGGDRWVDSDSSTFPKDDTWPAAYVEHLTNLKRGVLASTHAEVRQGLSDAKVPYVLCYPRRDCKEEYLQRYKERGSPQGFIDLLDKSWDEWIDEMENADVRVKYVLKPGEYISDYFLK